MHLPLTILAALLACSAPLYAQTIKALGYNTTNGRVVANTGTNVLTFTNTSVAFGINATVITPAAILNNNSGVNFEEHYLFYDGQEKLVWRDDRIEVSVPIRFNGTNVDSDTRSNLGFSTNLNTLWLATNASGARSAVGLGATNAPTFNGVNIGNWLISTNASGHIQYNASGLGGTALTLRYDTLELGSSIAGSVALAFGSSNTTGAAISRTNLGLGLPALTNTNVTNFRTAIGLGQSNDVTFQAITAQGLSLGLGASSWMTVDETGIEVNVPYSGNITITQTDATNGLLFIRRTNNEAFLGMANLIASNNTTVSNETLFRVGVSEATNKAAQFGFRSTNTNGNGVAVFSVFGFNALMMVGADASTNAVIYSGGGTNNEVMTLIRDGATEFARPIRFSTNASTRPSTNAPANTTNVAAWVEMRIGTNSYRVQLFQ